MKHATIEEETESIRQLVIASRKSPDVAAEAQAGFERLAAATRRTRSSSPTKTSGS